MDTISGAAVLLEQNGKILLTLRKAGENIGAWELPAGHVKEGEPPEVTAREVYEETGLEIAQLELVEIFNTTNIYRASIVGGELENREPDRHENIAWWPLDALPEPLGPSAEHILEK